MQYWILAAVFIALFIIIAGKNIISLRKRQAIRNRKIIPVDKTWINNFTGIDKTKFKVVWREISTLLNVDEDRLNSSDKLKEIAKLYPFPENLYDDLEEYMIRMGIHQDISKENIAERTIGDLVKDILSEKNRDTQISERKG